MAARFVTRLKQDQELGLVRKDVDLSAASDLIRDSIHSAILRHTAYRWHRNYYEARHRPRNSKLNQEATLKAALATSAA
jgi:hypothetical protein